MKLRLLGNSIRLRLTRTDVNALGEGRPVVERTEFADGAALEFALVPADVEGIEAHFDGQRLAVRAPTALLTAWASSDRVALAEPDPGAVPAILVEKDFACLSPRAGDDDADTYAHPEEGSSRC